MSQRSLFWPIALILVVATTMVMAFTHATVDLHAARLAAEETCLNPTTEAAAYIVCYTTATARAATATAAAAKKATINPEKIIANCPTDGPAHSLHYPPYPDCLRTRTAILAQTEQAEKVPTIPAEPLVTNNTSAQPASAATPTPTFTSTPTATRTAVAAVSATPLATATLRIVTHATPTATLPAAVPTPDIAATACIPGDVITVEGSADPELALIVTFGDRPVGGGFTRNDGSYRIRLRIGDERPGIYVIQVQERATRSLVQQFSCQVPAFTPTPTLPLMP